MKIIIILNYIRQKREIQSTKNPKINNTNSSPTQEKNPRLEKEESRQTKTPKRRICQALSSIHERKERTQTQRIQTPLVNERITIKISHKAFSLICDLFCSFFLRFFFFLNFLFCFPFF